MIRREVARLGVALIFGFGDPVVERAPAGRPARALDAFVVGNQRRSTLTEVAGHQHGGAGRAVAGPGAGPVRSRSADLTDAAIPMDEVLGRTGARLVEQLGNATTWARRFALLDRAFSAPGAVGAAVTTVSPEVAWLCHRLRASGGQARVEPLMDETGWSRRRVTERFHAQLGLAPKAYARILRFRRALGLLEAVGPGRTLADVAMDCGYYDQSHLTRDFIALAGCTPGALRAASAADPGVRFLQDDEVFGAVP